MSKYPTFFSDAVQIVRFDGHSANGLIPIGTHINISFGTASVQTLTPPADAVAFIATVGGTLRYTIDGVTAATNSSVGLTASNSIIYIKPGNTLSVAGAVSALFNLQWFGSV